MDVEDGLCWNCESAADVPVTCTSCDVAVYCSEQCMTDDIHSHLVRECLTIAPRECSKCSKPGKNLLGVLFSHSVPSLKYYAYFFGMSCYTKRYPPHPTTPLFAHVCVCFLLIYFTTFTVKNFKSFTTFCTYKYSEIPHTLILPDLVTFNVPFNRVEPI